MHIFVYGDSSAASYGNWTVRCGQRPSPFEELKTELPR